MHDMVGIGTQDTHSTQQTNTSSPELSNLVWGEGAAGLKLQVHAWPN